MGLFRFLFKWSLQITGTSIVGYNYLLKPEQQANLYGTYRSCLNSYRAACEIYSTCNQYKALLQLKQNPQAYNQKLFQLNKSSAKRLQCLSRQNQGVYMRLGQYLSHLQLSFPQQFTTILSSLEKNPNYQAQDYKYLKKHIQAQLGKTTKQLFQTLNTNPIHTDLFYQVYKGQLLENFLDINLKILRPYAKQQAKYDFWFLKKAVNHIEKFQKDNFPQTQPLMLNFICQNLQQTISKQLNLKSQEENALKIKQKLSEIIASQKSLTQQKRTLPVYVPHVYSQYCQQKVLIQEYFEGYHFSNVDSIIKQNFDIKTISADVVNIWNLLRQKGIVLQSYTPSNIFIRKSRPNESGPYQICLLNFSHFSTLPKFINEAYSLLWKEMISGKKLNQKNSNQRKTSIKTFYKNLALLSFSQFLSNSQSMQSLKQKSLLKISSKQCELVQQVRSELPSQIIKKLDDKKLLGKKPKVIESTSEIRKDYKNIRKAFEIQYQPWKLDILFNTYKQIFREEQNFALNL